VRDTGKTPSAPKYAKGRASPMMADDQNPNAVVHDSVQEMIRKAFEVNAPEIPFPDSEIFRMLGRFQEDCAQLGLKLISQVSSGDSLVVVQNL
jgi:hypothetical protein